MRIFQTMRTYKACPLHFISLFSYLFIFMCVHILPLCMFCIPCLFLLPLETRRWCWNFWNLSYRLLKIIMCREAMKHGFCAGKVSIHNHWTIFPAYSLTSIIADMYVHIIFILKVTSLTSFLFNSKNLKVGDKS